MFAAARARPASRVARGALPAGEPAREGAAKRARGARRGDNRHRDRWAASLRRGPRDALEDPPGTLRDVCVIFCSPKTASNVGAMARACAAFECCDFRVATPLCDVECRACVNAAKGAQWLVPSAADAHASLEDALRGTVGTVVGFHPWRLDDAEAEASRARFDDLAALTAAYPGGGEDGGKLALVFGNEADGLSERELALCDALCSIPMGRLIESLSVTHAAVIALSRFFEAREASAEARRWF